MRAKKYLIAANEIKLLLTDWDGADGCIATDRITVDGLPVGYMYREKPAEGTEFEGYDSGWRFFAGDEDDEYVDNADNGGIYKLNTICNYSPEIIPFLGLPTVLPMPAMKTESFSTSHWNAPTKCRGFYRD